MIVERPSRQLRGAAGGFPANRPGRRRGGGRQGQGFGPLDPGRQFQTAGEVFRKTKAGRGSGTSPQARRISSRALPMRRRRPAREAAQIAQGSDPVGGEPLPHFRRPGGNGNGQGGQGGPAGFRIGPRGVQAPRPASWRQGSRRRRPGDRIALLPTAGEGGGGQGLRPPTGAGSRRLPATKSPAVPD